MRRTMVIGAATTLVLLVVALAVFVRLIEPRMAFFPLKGEDDSPRKWGVDYGPFTVRTADGVELRGWTLRASQSPPRARVVYFHGNGGNLSIWAPILAGVARQGYEVAAFDYRGYGLSTGRPTERGLYLDVESIVSHVDRPAEASGARLPLIYWGRSLGAAMASYGATVKRPDGLILEAGFPDARSLLRGSPLPALLSLFSSYRFPAAEFLKRLDVPILVLHGDRDSVIPFAQGQALFNAIQGQKEFFTIRGGDHNDAVARDPQAYWQTVDRFVRSLKL